MDHAALQPATAVSITHTLPPTVAAGELTRWSVTIAADQAILPGSMIALVRRWPDDGGRPQWHAPDAPNFVSARASNGARICLEAQRREEWHPFDHALLVALAEGLPAGESLTVAFGELPSAGFEVQTFIERASATRILMRQAGGAWKQVGEIAGRVIGGAQARLTAIAPSVVGVREAFDLLVRVEDQWGNPANGPDLDVVTACGAGTAITARNGSVARIRMRLAAEGVHRIEVSDRSGRLRAVSNPVRCLQGNADRIYWGDLHAQSANGCGAQKLADYFAFARDFAGVDFAGHQGNCFLLSKADWQESQEVTKRFNADARFLALLGYEWSGDTAVGGDHNVYFPGDTGELRRCSHRHVEDASDIATDLPHITDLHDQVRGSDVLMAVHVGGRTSNLQWHEPGTERLLEVHSTHATSEWFLFEALRRGYRLGVIGGSDGVDGRPGASHPGRMSVRNLRGGLAAVKMPALSRAHLWTSLRARSTYATTGQRILLDVDVGGHGLGQSCEAVGAPSIGVHVEATSPLLSVEIFRGCTPVFAAPIAPEDPSPSGKLRLSWFGAAAPGNWARARLTWEGRIEVAGGRLLSACDWGSDTPAEGLSSRSSQALLFRSITAGNWNGVELEIEEGPETALRFVCGMLDTLFPLDTIDVAGTQRQWDQPLRLVRLERLPRAPAPLGWSGVHVDAGAPAGEHAYWIRVRQDDGGAAWSTPVYVRVAP